MTIADGIAGVTYNSRLEETQSGHSGGRSACLPLGGLVSGPLEYLLSTEIKICPNMFSSLNMRTRLILLRKRLILLRNKRLYIAVNLLSLGSVRLRQDPSSNDREYTSKPRTVLSLTLRDRRIIALRVRSTLVSRIFTWNWITFHTRHTSHQHTDTDNDFCRYLVNSPSLILTRLIALKVRFDSLLLVSAIMSASLRATVPCGTHHLIF